MDTTDTIRRIEKDLGLSEAYQVTTFQGIKENADGGWQEITLDMLDAGRDAEDRRYVEGRTAPTVDGALADVGAQLG
jgi:hypothetical protein